MPQTPPRPAAAPPDGRLHEDLYRNEAVAGPSNRRFGLTIGIAMGIVGAVRLALDRTGWGWLLGAAAVLMAFALCWPAALAPLNRTWLHLGLLLNRIVGPVVLALLFFSTMVPIAALMRLRGKDPLRLRRDPAAASYWIERQPHGPPPATMRNQF